MDALTGGTFSEVVRNAARISGRHTGRWAGSRRGGCDRPQVRRERLPDRFDECRYPGEVCRLRPGERRDDSLQSRPVRWGVENAPDRASIVMELEARSTMNRIGYQPRVRYAKRIRKDKAMQAARQDHRTVGNLLDDGSVVVCSPRHAEHATRGQQVHHLGLHGLAVVKHQASPIARRPRPGDACHMAHEQARIPHGSCLPVEHQGGERAAHERDSYLSRRRVVRSRFEGQKRTATPDPGQCLRCIGRWSVAKVERSIDDTTGGKKLGLVARRPDDRSARDMAHDGRRDRVPKVGSPAPPEQFDRIPQGKGASVSTFK